MPIVTEAEKLPQYLNNAQFNSISQKTPKQFVKSRPGPGGMSTTRASPAYSHRISR